MTPLKRLTAELAYPVKTPAAGHDWVGVRADDLALVLAVVTAARGIDDYGWLPKNDWQTLRAALAAIEGSKP